MKVNKWGGYSSSGMSWNSGRLRKGQIQYWQYRLYNVWYYHGLSIHQMGTPWQNRWYKGIVFAKCFYDFDNFVRAVSLLKDFSLYKQNPKLYEIDKDAISKEWSPSSIKIVTKQQNNNTMLLQNPYVYVAAVKSISKQCKAYYNGVLYGVYQSQAECSRATGVDHRIISECISKNSSFNGWTFVR